nr:unnamed protein product [Callosobruchus analis]
MSTYPVSGPRAGVSRAGVCRAP